MFKKGTRIYIVAFEPGGGTGGVGGFEWCATAKEAKRLMGAFLKEEDDLDSTYLIRSAVLPRDFDDRDEVTMWLDTVGRYLWETSIDRERS